MKTIELWVYDREQMRMGEPQTIVHGFNCSIESVQTAKEYADKNFAAELDVMLIVRRRAGLADDWALVSSRYAGMEAKWLDADPFPIRGRGRPEGAANKVPSAANTRLLVKGLKWIKNEAPNYKSFGYEEQVLFPFLAHLTGIERSVIEEAFLKL